jgi:hypothetical protein
MSTKTATATAIETVVMQDDTIREFAGKRKLLKESFITPEGEVQIRLDFRNGESRLFTIPTEMLTKFAAHGAEQKLGDEIAGLEDVEDCVIAVDELIDRLYNKEWSQKREANGMAGTSTLARALVEQSGKTIEQIKVFLSKKTQAEKVALRNNPKIKPIVDRIESEKASKKSSVDTDALLNELA